jgi:glucosyl-3-phosphoglycerate synthase
VIALPAPDPALLASVVVPARDEERLVPRCLEALAAQTAVGADQYEVLLVLDRCTDGTAEAALAAATHRPELRLHLLDGPGRGVGHARRLGMDTACERLRALGRPGGLVASTDADSVVDRDWVAAQLGLAAGGARAIGGRIDILAEDAAALPPTALAAREQSIRHRVERARAREPLGADHGHFSGASMALTAEAYGHVGGLEPRRALEDEALARALERHGVPILRSDSVRVRTSGRTVGRAPRGLAHDLALAARRTLAP